MTSTRTPPNTRPGFELRSPHSFISGNGTLVFFTDASIFMSSAAQSIAWSDGRMWFARGIRAEDEDVPDVVEMGAIGSALERAVQVMDAGAREDARASDNVKRVLVWTDSLTCVMRLHSQRDNLEQQGDWPRRLSDRGIPPRVLAIAANVINSEDVVISLIDELRARDVVVEIDRVPGHQGFTGNMIADIVAKHTQEHANDSQKRPWTVYHYSGPLWRAPGLTRMDFFGFREPRVLDRPLNRHERPSLL